MTTHMTELAAFKQLTRAFLAEGQLAERENHPGNAAASYLDAIRLGHECCRGGVLVDALVGAACQSIGCQALESVAGQLPAADCSRARQRLEEMDATTESATDVLQHERTWSRRAFGWRSRLYGLLMRQGLKQSGDRAAAHLTAQQRAARRLLIKLSARSYELDTGHPPGKVSDLVPGILKAIPVDPMTGANLALP
jgi:hypothetical protein